MVLQLKGVCKVANDDKVIIVEGLTDKKQIEKIITESVIILCTHGTYDLERFDELIEKYELDHRDVYILVDEDDAGKELRKQIIRELPHSTHVHVSEEYKEVAATPENLLANIFVRHNIKVNPFYLQL